MILPPSVVFYPDINNPNYTSTSSRAGFGWPNCIVVVSSRHFLLEQEFPPMVIVLPVKGVLSIDVGGKNYHIDSHTYLVVPARTPLSIEKITGPKGGDSPKFILVFFNPTFIRNVWNLQEEAFHPLVRCYRFDSLASRIVSTVSSFTTVGFDPHVTDADVEDLFYELVIDLAQRDDADRSRWFSLTKDDQSTALSLFAQISRARDFADTHFPLSIGVDEMASEACLSKYHFIRVFDRAFGTTPYKYLQNLRMKESIRLLEEGKLSVSEICRACGFISLGSFSWKFRQHFGEPPSDFGKAIIEKSVTRNS